MASAGLRGLAGACRAPAGADGRAAAALRTHAALPTDVNTSSALLCRRTPPATAAARRRLQRLTARNPCGRPCAGSKPGSGFVSEQQSVSLAFRLLRQTCSFHRCACSFHRCCSCHRACNPCLLHCPRTSAGGGPAGAAAAAGTGDDRPQQGPVLHAQPPGAGACPRGEVIGAQWQAGHGRLQACCCSAPGSRQPSGRGCALTPSEPTS